VRTLLAIVVGLVLLAVVVALARRRPGPALAKALAVFGVVWFMACVVDLFIGLWSGYPFLDELFIHLLIFAVPVAAAVLVGRRVARR